MSDIKTQMMLNMMKAEFKRGVEAGSRKTIQMFRLIPVEKWPALAGFLETADYEKDVWPKVDAMVKEDEIFNAQVIE